MQALIRSKWARQSVLLSLKKISIYCLLSLWSSKISIGELKESWEKKKLKKNFLGKCICHCALPNHKPQGINENSKQTFSKKIKEKKNLQQYTIVSVKHKLDN